MLSLFNKNNFYKNDEIIQVKTIIIPFPTSKYGTYIFKQHKIPFELATQSILKYAKIPSNDKIYLSRTKAKNLFRAIENETLLEKHLKDKGYKIIYAEQLSLKDQIKIINGSNLIIGCKGSAFHNLLFDLETKSKTIIIIEDDDLIDVTFPMIDHIKEINTIYIGGLTRIDRSNIHCNRILNFNYVVDELEKLKVI